MLYFLLECIIEFFGFAINIIYKYLLYDAKIVDIYMIDEWNVVFMYFIYTTIHNINYGYLKINNYHAKHHDNVNTNIGPDIFDLIFNTKNEDTPNNELVDHYIPNIIISFIAVMILKHVYTNNKKICKTIFMSLYVIMVVILTISCVLIFDNQINTLINDELVRFV